MRLAPDTADPWCACLPQLHRALADPAQAAGLPAPSPANNFEAACEVWETLHYLLTALLGWTSPSRGLAWWYCAGKPTDDSPHLRLVRDHWDHAGALDYYAAWAWQPPGVAFMQPDDVSPTELGKTSAYRDEEWWRQFKRRGQETHHDPFYGGTNALHLGHSDDFGMAEVPVDASRLLWELPTRRATLIVSHIRSWRHELAQAASKLPALGDRSWHVEVFDRQTGYLGLYRRSRQTGRWFAGPHSLHMHGQQVGTAAGETA